MRFSRQLWEKRDCPESRGLAGLKQSKFFLRPDAPLWHPMYSESASLFFFRACSTSSGRVPRLHTSEKILIAMACM